MSKDSPFPEPDTEYGYTLNYLKEILGDEEWRRFEKWSAGGITGAMDPKTLQPVVYRHDVEAFLTGTPHLD